MNTIRASSFWVYLDCAYRAQKMYLEGLQRPSNPAALIGTAVHESTSVYDYARLKGDIISPDDAAGVAIDIIQHPWVDVDWRKSDVSKTEAESVAMVCHSRYCADIAPTREYAAVEEKLKPLVVRAQNGVKIELTGTLDRIRLEGQAQGVSDIKTGAAAVSTDGTAKAYRHGPQLGMYELLAENTMNARYELAPEIIGLQTGGKARVGTATIPNAKQALVGTAEHAGFIDHVAQYFKSGLFPPNPGSILCSERYCPAWDVCPYHT